MDLLDNGKNYELHPQCSFDCLKEWIDRIEKKGVKDIIVISHGWNTSPSAAWEQYQELFGNISTLIEKNGLKPSGFGIIGITWNSLSRFLNADSPTGSQFRTEIANNPEAQKQIQEKERKVKELGGDLSSFFQRTYGPFLSDQCLNTPNDDLAEALEELNSSILQLILEDEDYCGFDRLEEETNSIELQNFDDSEAYSGGSDATIAGGIDLGIPLPWDFHFHMKRAFCLGQRVVSPTLTKLREENGLQIHLVGHSFGALLVSATAHDAVAHEDKTKWAYASLTLVQGAFSQNAFANDPVVFSFISRIMRKKQGIFRSVLKHNAVKGPISATYTSNDGVLGWGYPNAAIWLGLDGTKPYKEGIFRGPLLEPFGAIGHKGAQGIGKPVPHGDLATHSLVAGEINNLEASKVITGDFFGAHSNVWIEPVAELIVRAVKCSVEAN